MKHSDDKSFSPVSMPARSRSANALKHQQGIGIIEVMIGVLIFAGGVASISSMQSHAIRTSHDSIQRSQAVWMANAASEMMKINVSGLVNSSYQLNAYSARMNRNSYCGSAPKQCIGNSCSSAEMAAFDVHDLMCRNGHNMINPEMAIICPNACPPGSEITVTVSWDSRGAVEGMFMTRQQVAFTFKRN